MIAIVDYGMGNLRSAQKGLERAQVEAVITDDRSAIAAADAVVLPGVGAYRDCYEGLRQRDLVGVVQEAAHSGKPFLGICVGMQLLFEGSEEGQCDEGLGIFRGRVVRFPDMREQALKVPHMGWNEVRVLRENPLIPAEAHPYAYFVHSYFAEPAEPEIVVASCSHGVSFPAVIGRDNVYAVQFHPEKSQEAGIELLTAFGRMTRRAA
jgi:glutamine amidotransferase